MIKIILLFICLLPSVLPQSFIITDDYVNDFKAGIQKLEKSAEKYDWKEENFDFNLYKPESAEPDSQDYDFIIVGAGPAGSVLANRLSEKLEWKILLLEAGGPESEFSKIPRYDYLMPHTDFNWGYKTTPQKTWCLSMINNQCAIASGKALGGGTAINGMLYSRGNPDDYDIWASQGNKGWSYSDVLPYFKKAESADLPLFDYKYRNRDGPFHVEHPRYTTAITPHTLSAAQEVGLNIIDYNGKQQLGFGLAQLSTKFGHRQSAAEAYLKPASKRTNLNIKPFSHVIKILIDPKSKEATGVLYLHNKKLYSAKARKEVIISSGTFHSPKLLMLSGVGPRKQLENLGIPVIQDLNVGQHFKNHVGFFGLDYIYNGTIPQDSPSGIDEVVDYLKNGRGRLSTNGFETIGYIRTNVSPREKRPDLEIFFMENYLSGDASYNPLLYKDEVFKKLWKPVENKISINVGLLLTHPKSHGTLSLKDKDPFHAPLIDPNQLSDPDNVDINTLLQGIRFAIKFMDTKAMEKLNLVVNDNPVPGCEQYLWGCDDYWKCAIKHLTISFRHQTGTCKMGPKTDKNAVVDNTLRVYGIKRLRVADSSVIPVTTSGHTMAPTIMVGENAADLIKSSWT